MAEQEERRDPPDDDDETESDVLEDEDEDDDEDDDRGAMRRFLDWCWDAVRTWAPAILTVLLIRSVVAEPFRIPSGSMVPTLQIGDHILVTKYSYGLRFPLTRIPLTELKVPERGDVVVFVFPESDYEKDGRGQPTEPSISYYMDLPVPPFATLDYVKRVVGLPGDSIEVRDNVIYLNGEPQEKTKVGPYNFVDDHCRENATVGFTEDLGGVEHDLLNSASEWRVRDYGPAVVPEGHFFAMGDNRDHSEDSRAWGFVPLRNLKGKAQFVWLSYDRCRPGLPFFGEFRNDRFGTPVR